jgi:hypothetical protein
LPGTVGNSAKPNAHSLQKEITMPVRIENQTCYFKVNDDGQEHSLAASAVTVSTDIPKAMSYVELGAERVYVTEQEADALTVAGATDGRQHKKVTEPGSAI